MDEVSLLDDHKVDVLLDSAAMGVNTIEREGVAIAIEESDIREKIREKRIGNFIVFVVNASGSMGAGKRMIETKGAILSLLLDAYQKTVSIADTYLRWKGQCESMPQDGSKFRIRAAKGKSLLVNSHSKCSPGTRMET